MIQSAHIRGFKSLFDVKLDLGRFNVFVGPGGAGKTNVLEAFGLVADGIHREGIKEIRLWRRGIRPGAPSRYLAGFSDRGSGAVWIAVSDHLGNKRTLIVKPDPEDPILWSVREKAEAGPGQPAVSPETVGGPLEAELARYGVYALATPILQGAYPDPMGGEPLGFSGGNLADVVTEVLAGPNGRRLESLIEELIPWSGRPTLATPRETHLSQVVPTRRHVLALHDRRLAPSHAAISAFDAPESALHALALVSLVLHPNAPPVVAIDGADQALDAPLALAVVDELQSLVLRDESRPQLLLTLRHAAGLDALALEDDRVRLFEVERLLRGDTVVRRVTARDADALRAGNGGDALSSVWTRDGSMNYRPD